MAAGLQPDDEPLLIWGQPAAHVCLGQSQNAAAELAAKLDVPALQRPLGGGTVWIDHGQCCLALVAPLDLLPQRPAQWFDLLLDPMAQVYREAGLPLTRAGRDLHCRGRKIAGSGAATLGRAGVVASSFLLDFPIARFMPTLACPSKDFRRWLEEALDGHLTWWRREARVPAVADLAGAFRRASNVLLGWRWVQSQLAARELDARLSWREELLPEAGGETRLVRHGIKIGHAVYLTETSGAWGWVRTLTQGPRIARLALSAGGVAESILANVFPGHDEIAAALAPRMGHGAVEWSARILDCARFEEEL